MRLIQYTDAVATAIGLVNEQDGETIQKLNNVNTVYTLAQKAIASETTIENLVLAMDKTEEHESLSHLLQSGRVLSPVHHPDAAHLHITGTGLTHLGSAQSRNAMHENNKQTADNDKTDSMKIFDSGLRGGKPDTGQIGVQPEWFYKGNGYMLCAPETHFPVPAFGLDASEEPELAGIYINDSEGKPHRIGYAIGNELSDHVTERQNYLYLSHSKLRVCSIGPELFVGELPQDLTGRSRILRDGKIIWEKEFKTGEANMSHSIANLEHHHFKYKLYRQPNELHIHFFGTATLSFGEVLVQAGDEFEIQVPELGKALRNTLQVEDDEGLIKVKSL